MHSCHSFGFVEKKGEFPLSRGLLGRLFPKPRTPLGDSTPKANANENSNATKRQKRKLPEVSFRRAVLGLAKFQKDVKQVHVQEEVISKARNFGELVAFTEWFRGLVFVLASADLLPVLNELSGGSEEGRVFLSAVVGGVVGASFALANSIAQRRLWAGPGRPLNIVITGSTRGLGKAIAREFLKSGDKVFVTSSTAKGVQQALLEFRSDLRKWGMDPSMVLGSECDVSSPANVARLASLAKNQMKHVDVWVNCAGYSGSFKDFTSTSNTSLAKIVNTNLLGSILCTKHAVSLMRNQTEGGHVFNTEGAGSDFSATPKYAAYGATKAAITQLTTSIQGELNQERTVIGVHTIQPGMVLTKLLLEGATVQNKQFFNILCEQPETVAAFLVPRMRSVVARKKKGERLTYLTMTRALERFLTAPLRTGRFFDKEGLRVYPSESERMYGPFSKVTARLANNARDRRKHLATIYSLCMVMSFLWMQSNV